MTSRFSGTFWTPPLHRHTTYDLPPIWRHKTLNSPHFPRRSGPPHERGGCKSKINSSPRQVQIQIFSEFFTILSTAKNTRIVFRVTSHFSNPPPRHTSSQMSEPFSHLPRYVIYGRPPCETKFLKKIYFNKTYEIKNKIIHWVMLLKIFKTFLVWPGTRKCIKQF